MVGAAVGGAVAGGLAGGFVGNQIDNSNAEREKMLMQDKRYRDAMEDIKNQINANNQFRDTISDIQGKINGTIPRQSHETDEYLNNQLVVALNSLKNGEDRLNSLKSVVDELRKELSGGFWGFLGLNKLGFTDKVILIGGVVLVIWLLKG
jgi:hypothetical protein